MKLKKIWYKRYEKPRHFSPASGYNCPIIPLGNINCKGCDYEIVVVEKSENCHLEKGRQIMISWGLNITLEKAEKLNQVLAFNTEFQTELCEIVLAVSV